MPQTPSNHSEKRDFIRMRIDTEVSLLHEGQVIAAVCLDLSSGGMQVQAPQRFQVGDTLEVRIDSDHKALKGLHASTEVVDFCQRLPAHQLVAMGSSLKLCLVADGSADLYPRLGPTMAWDTAAAHAVLAAAGGEVVAADSRQPLRYNRQESLLNPHFLAASTAVLAALA